MSWKRVTAVLLLCTAALLLTGCLDSLPGLDGEEADVDAEPGLVDFRSTDARCAEDFQVNASTSIESGDELTTVNHRQNLSLDDSSHEAGTVVFDALNDSAYTLDVPTRSTGDAGDGCDGAAYLRYNATVRLATDDGSWDLFVSHDGEEATHMFGDSNRSGASASVSSGAEVGDGDTTSSGGTSDGEDQPPQIRFDELPEDAQDELLYVLENGSLESDEPPALYEALDLGDDRAHVRYDGGVYEPVVANLTESEDAVYDYRVTLRQRDG